MLCCRREGSLSLSTFQPRIKTLGCREFSACASVLSLFLWSSPSYSSSLPLLSLLSPPPSVFPRAGERLGIDAHLVGSSLLGLPATNQDTPAPLALVNQLSVPPILRPCTLPHALLCAHPFLTSSHLPKLFFPGNLFHLSAPSVSLPAAPLRSIHRFLFARLLNSVLIVFST